MFNDVIDILYKVTNHDIANERYYYEPARNTSHFECYVYCDILKDYKKVRISYNKNIKLLYVHEYIGEQIGMIVRVKMEKKEMDYFGRYGIINDFIRKLKSCLLQKGFRVRELPYFISVTTNTDRLKTSPPQAEPPKKLIEIDIL